MESSAPEARGATDAPESPALSDDAAPKGDGIVTTELEIEAFYLVKNMLRDVVDPSRVSYKDTVPYFIIYIDGNPLKWLCRLFLCTGEVERKSKYVQFPVGDKIPIKAIDDLFAHKARFVSAINDRAKGKDAPKPADVSGADSPAI